jgi:hypothetical protein
MKAMAFFGTLRSSLVDIPPLFTSLSHDMVECEEGCDLDSYLARLDVCTIIQYDIQLIHPLLTWTIRTSSRCNTDALDAGRLISTKRFLLC